MSSTTGTIAGPLRIQRINSLDGWDFYRVGAVEREGLTFTLGLRSHVECDQIEYEVWRDGSAAPQRQGSVPLDDASPEWVNVAHSHIITTILGQLESEG